MAFNDPISDFLTRMRNALQARHRYVDVDWSVMKEKLATILKDQRFIEHYLIKKEKTRGTIRLFLKYDENRRSVIQGLRRYSTPGRHTYVGYEDIRPVYGGMGIVILSTSKGVMAGQDARKNKVGGELLCSVW